MRAIVLVVGVLLLVSDACAAEPTASGDPLATLVEGLVVNATAPGPAWWRVSKGEAVVYVMGLPTVTTKTVAFDDGLLRRRLDGADRLILAPAPHVNVFGVLGLLFGAKRLFRQPTPMSQTLPSALAERVRTLLVRRGQKPDAYDKLRPAFAGFVLANSDDGKSLTIDIGGVQDRIEALAKSRALKVRPRIVPTGRYELLPQLKSLGALPAEAQAACLEEGLRAAESGQGGVQALTAHWARGQVRDLVAADRGFEACLSGSPTVAADIRRGEDASTSAIVDALVRPGLSVALVDLRPLLAQDGVLDRLRRAGFEVRSPAGG